MREPSSTATFRLARVRSDFDFTYNAEGRWRGMRGWNNMTARSRLENVFDSLVKARALLSLGVLACFLSPAYGQLPSTLVLKQTIALPAVHGAFNHMSVDAEHQRLFVPAPADKTLEVVDLRTGEPWRRLPAQRPTTALYARESGQLYLTSGHYLLIYDGKTVAQIANMDLHSRLDQLQYDADANELYVGCMTAGATGIAVVNVREQRVVTKIPLPSSPQGFALERGGPRMFVNLPDDNSVVVIDRRERKVAATWKLENAADNFPMALDEDQQRLLIATRTPAEMLALDTRSGRIVARVTSVGDADDMWFDTAQRRIYISGSGGFLSVIQQRDPDHYAVLSQVRTPPGAANSNFSSQTQLLYVGIPHEGRAGAAIRVYSTAR